MDVTERLYYQESRLLEFDAVVISVSERDGGQIAVTLDRTAFYPTGGGQPTDTGTLGDARVVDCIDAESDCVLHVIQGSVPEIGDRVHGKIDWLRRLDHPVTALPGPRVSRGIAATARAAIPRGGPAIRAASWVRRER